MQNGLLVDVELGSVIRVVMSSALPNLCDVGRGRYVNVITAGPTSSESVVFFVHGSCGSASQFSEQIAHFSAQYRVIAFDAFGCGSSPKPKDWVAYSHENMLADLRVIFDRYRGRSNVLCAHSYGSALAMRLAAQLAAEGDGSVIGGIALLGTAAEFPGGTPAVFFLPEWLLRCLQPAMSRAFVRMAFADTPSSQNLREAALASSNRNPMYMCKAFYRQARWASPREIGTVATRVLIIAGADDGITPASGGKELERHLLSATSVRLELVEQAGHQMMQEQPGRVNALLSDFFFPS